MKKTLIVALTLLSFGASASTVVQSVNKNDGVFKDGLDSSKLVADFDKCQISSRGVVDTSAETMDCVPGKQFSLMWSDDGGFAISTYVKMNNGKAAVSQTRVGNHSYLSAGFNVGFVATIPAK